MQGFKQSLIYQMYWDAKRTSKTRKIIGKITVYIGKSIKFIRASARLSQEALADKLNISTGEILLLENNCSEASDVLLEKISSVFQVSKSFLLWESQMPSEGANPKVTSQYDQIRSNIHELQHLRIAQSSSK